ncbi:MATH and LRR domain-containing protein PFE0570w-like isoform X2 [Daktulosphaira vitifoliae]|uniref:MATH and LRR domain-containing protein PFE0570w-like isoform X2 n=1 Tax=Daktulosphaira vitifoliae TaxID=58002 RepID=UPI0021AAF01B|nr:MATH and LRR domain-containing protein PFE0570w-like isoform X2 [Daktulosphaira vitifoliae]
MASLPQPKFEPKAPDKSSSVSRGGCDDSTIINERDAVIVDKKYQNCAADCSNNNKSKSLSVDLSNLNTASFKSLLEEVVAYDTAKQTKSELYNNLLEDVTQNGEDDVKRPLLNQRLVDSQTDLSTLISKEQHIKKETSSLEAFDLAPDFKKRLSTTKVSARQLEGGSLPSHVNHAQALSLLINKKSNQNTRKKIAESSKMAKNVDKTIDLGDPGYEQIENKDLSNYTSHASLEISSAKEEVNIDERFTTPLLSKSSQNFDDQDSYIETDSSAYSKNGVTKVLPRTSGEGDQDVKHCIHQPTIIPEFNKDSQMIDHRLLHLFAGQNNCYQNPYNGYTSPMSFHFLTPNDNLGIQTTINNNRRNNYDDTNSNVHKRNKQKKELKKKDEVVFSENIQGYRGDKNIDEILKFIGDLSNDSKKNKTTKIKNKNRNGKGSDDDSGRPKNRKGMKIKYNSVEEVSSSIFQPMDSSDDESKSIKSCKKSKKKEPKKNQTSKKFASTDQRLDVLSSESQDTDSADFLLVTNKQRRKKQNSQNKLNASSNNFPPHDSYLLSQYIQPKNVNSKKRRKSTSSMPHSEKSDDNSDLDSVHSLPASSTPSKQQSFKGSPKTDITKPACVVTTSEESIPTVTVTLPQRIVEVTTNIVNNANEYINGDVHVTYIVHESSETATETVKKTAVLNKVPAVISPQSASLTVRLPSKKKQSPIMYNKYEVDTSLSFGFEIDQNLLCDGNKEFKKPEKIPIEYNYNEVILFIKQAWQDVEKEKINGRSNILEYTCDTSDVRGDD